MFKLPDIAEKAETFTVLIGCWDTANGSSTERSQERDAGGDDVY
jgi:hypothetical protein|tara:strand:- start:824 stop:955 length:132 start_codon:yes stop_codon:yes gene_type:complete